MCFIAFVDLYSAKSSYHAIVVEAIYIYIIIIKYSQKVDQEIKSK